MKKVTNEDVAKFIQDCANEVNEELENRIFVAQTHFERAEKQFIDCLSPEQKKLFDEYNEERQYLVDLYVEKSKFLSKK